VTGPIVSVIGGGQLARMMVPPASELGITLRVLVENEHTSAAQVVVDSPVGVASDHDAVTALVHGADVLTFEHEHVPNELLSELISQGVSVQPGPEALLQAQDKIVMRAKLTQMNVPCPPWQALSTDTRQLHCRTWARGYCQNLTRRIRRQRRTRSEHA